MFGLVVVAAVDGEPGRGASARAIETGGVCQIMTANTHAIRRATSVRGRPPQEYDDMMKNTPGAESPADEDEMQRKTR